MTKKRDRLILDSNVYIRALRSEEFQRQIESFLQGAYLYSISKVVLMELWAGARTRVEEAILRQHQKELPVLNFADANFIVAGQILGRMEKDHHFELASRRRLTWDLLIALDAQNNDAVLITQNIADFRKIQKYVDFEFLGA